jgi:hypothetical protein
MLIFQPYLLQYRVAEIELGLNKEVPWSLLNIFFLFLVIYKQTIDKKPITCISTKKVMLWTNNITIEKWNLYKRPEDVYTQNNMWDI